MTTMAKKGPNKSKPIERPAPSREEPIQFIHFEPKDLRDREGRGGPPKIFEGFGPELLARLQSELADAVRELHPEMQAFPQAPGALILRLRDDAIAKSYRPKDLIARAGLHPAGHNTMPEVLIAGHLTELRNLSYWIDGCVTMPSPKAIDLRI
jgi:hypothetical protein